MKRQPGDLVTVRCGPAGHWLASLYRGPGGGLWLRYDTRHLLDPQTFRPIPSPRPGGRAENGTGHAPFLAAQDDDSWLVVSCRQCTRQYPMTATGADLLAAAVVAATGKPQTVIAKPTASVSEQPGR